MRILVAGIGNVFFGDDGFGVEVANGLAGSPLPEGVRLGEYGIRGVHLAYELLEGYDVLVLVDAMPMGATPGTVALVEVDPADLEGPATVDAHSMSPASVLAALGRLGGEIGRVVLVACEPSCLDEGIGLSAVVRAAVQPGIEAVRSLVEELVGASGAPIGAKVRV